MPAPLWLALAIAAQAPGAAAPAEPTPFRLGAAAATARVWHENGMPRIEVIVTNDTSGPIWWRGAGIGCVGIGMSWPPVDEDGREHPEFLGWGIGCSMEKNAPPTEAQLAAWRLDAGSSETITLHPFGSVEHDAEDAPKRALVPGFVRWVKAREFTLPRATPPPGTMDFACPDVLFAWDRALGLRVFVEQDWDLRLPHFDPFDGTPYFREDPVPVHFGPLLGTARLVPGRQPPRIEVELRNPQPWPVAWSPAPRDADRSAREDPALLLRPGDVRTLTLAPFEDGGAVLAVPGGRWEAARACTWPVAPAAPPGEWPAAVLHAVWDPRFGLTVNLADPGEEFDAFEAEDVLLRRAAVIRFGAAWLHASTIHGQPGSLQVTIRPAAESCHWLELPDWESPCQTFHYLGEELVTAPHEFDPEYAYPPPPWTASSLEDSLLTRDAPGSTDMDFDFSDVWARHYRRPRGAPFPAWEWTTPFMIPQARAPAHAPAFTLTTLLVRWDPTQGLSLHPGAAAPER